MSAASLIYFIWSNGGVETLEQLTDHDVFVWHAERYPSTELQRLEHGREPKPFHREPDSGPYIRSRS